MLTAKPQSPPESARVTFLDKSVQREFTTAMRVVGNNLVGKTIQVGCGIRRLGYDTPNP
jgi:hypothetical protein